MACLPFHDTPNVHVKKLLRWATTSGEGLLQRRQDLPQEAFFVPSAEDLANLSTRYDSSCKKFYFLALSYRWLTASPSGGQQLANRLFNISLTPRVGTSLSFYVSPEHVRSTPGLRMQKNFCLAERSSHSRRKLPKPPNKQSVTILLTYIHVTTSPGFHKLHAEQSLKIELVVTRQACPPVGPPCCVLAHLRTGSSNFRRCCFSNALVASYKHQHKTRI